MINYSERVFKDFNKHIDSLSEEELDELVKSFTEPVFPNTPKPNLEVLKLSKEEMFDIIVQYEDELFKLIDEERNRCEHFKGWCDIVGNDTEVLKSHLSAWFACNVRGLSNGFAYNYEYHKVINTISDILYYRTNK